MSENIKSLHAELVELQRAIAALEAQRAVLGQAVVGPALAAMQLRLAALRGETTEQRKLVTVLFADLVGFTALSETLDPEDVRELQQDYFARWRQAIEQLGGVVEKFIGDAVMALFGVPAAREDDPERAVKGALALHASLAELNAVRGVRLQMRAGVHTGLVLVSGASGEFVATGDTVNIAARLQANAPPGRTLISHDTYQHVRGLFEAVALPPLALKGKEEPLLTFLVERPVPSAFRIRARGVEGVETRMVGREAELTTLQKAYADVVADQTARLTLVVGEPGLGKSRLAYEFGLWLVDQDEHPLALRARAAPQSSATPAAVLRNLFSQRFAIDDTDSAAEVVGKFRAGTAGWLEPDEADLLGQFCGYDFSSSAAVHRLLGQDALANLGREYLAHYFERLGQARPLVLIVEDLHWADDRSLDALLALVTPRALAVPLMIIALTRPSFFERRPHWSEGLEPVTRLELKRLSRRESRSLVEEILQKVEQLAVDLRDLIVAASEGNPFFAEELVKMLVDDGVIVTAPNGWRVVTERVEGVRVPATLAGVLQARLDSLPQPEREALQRAAVVGREFWDEAVARLSDAKGDSREALGPILTALRNRELVYRHEHSAFAATAEFAFKHALLRDVTYETVLKRLRRTYHRQVAEWVEQRAGERTAEHAGLLAYHYQQAEARPQALKYLTLAAETALARYANQEAAAYYQQALELDPDDAARALLLDGLGRARARQGDYQAAITAWGEAIELYQRLGDSNRAARLYARSGRARWYMQDTPGSVVITRAGLEALAGAPASPGLAALYHELARAAFFNGQVDEAFAQCQQALEMAEEIHAVDVQADALATYGLLPQVAAPARLAALRRAIALAEAAGLLSIASRAHTNLGGVLGVQGSDVAEQAAAFRSAAQVARERGSVRDEAFALSNLLPTSAEAGDLQTTKEVRDRLRRLAQAQPASEWFQNLVLDAESIWLRHRGDLEHALKLMETVVAYLESNGDFEATSWAYRRLAAVLFELEMYASAEGVLLRSKALDDRHKELGVGVSSRTGLAAVWARLGHFDEAEALLAEAEAMAGSDPPAASVFDIRVGRARLARSRADWETALALYQQIIDAQLGEGWRLGATQLMMEMAEVHQARHGPGDREQAQALLGEALAAFKTMGAAGYVTRVEARLRALGAHPAP